MIKNRGEIFVFDLDGTTVDSGTEHLCNTKTIGMRILLGEYS